MNRPTLRSQLLRTYLLAALVPLIGLAVWLPYRLHRESLEQMRSELSLRASLIAHLLQQEWREHPDRLAARCHELGQTFRLRVTLIAEDGRVLGDSQADPAAMENHADRPEVIGALREGTGHSIRHSATLDQDLLYAAVRAQDGDRILGIVRLAEPLTQVAATIRNTQYILWGALVVAIATAVGLGFRFSTLLDRPIRTMSEAAARIANGEVGQPVRVEGSREIAEMSESFNRMSEQLATTIRQIAGDKKKLEAILENMADGIIIVSQEGNIQLFNESAERMLGVSGRRALGKPIILLTLNYRLTRMIENTLKTGTPQTGEIEVYIPAQRVLRVYIVPARDSAGRPLGAVVVMQDLTEIRRLEAIRRDFVANVSHELRTPITSIRTTAEALLSGARYDEKIADRFLETIVQEADRLTALVDDLLDLARAESQEIRLEQTDVDIRSLAGEILAKFDVIAGEKRLILSNEIEENLTLWADREALRQILTNLVDNAVKYTSPEGHVRVHAETDENFISIHVTDTGIGIPQEHLPRIFERFYRVDKARSRSLGGTGLGLSIVKHLVEAHGGSVYARSTLGQGSTFTVRLPRGFHPA